MKSLLYQLVSDYETNEILEVVKTFSKKQNDNLAEEVEYILLTYPQGTGDDKLEDVMEILSAYYWE